MIHNVIMLYGYVRIIDDLHIIWNRMHRNWCCAIAKGGRLLKQVGSWFSSTFVSAIIIRFYQPGHLPINPSRANDGSHVSLSKRWTNPKIAHPVRPLREWPDPINPSIWQGVPGSLKGCLVRWKSWVHRTGKRFRRWKRGMDMDGWYTYPSIHPFIQPPIHPCIRSFIRSFIPLFIWFELNQ